MSGTLTSARSRRPPQAAGRSSLRIADARPWLLAGAMLAALAACALLVLGRSGAATDPQALTDARAFLDRYVQADGRVVRPDQGGDTVSEGQAYALLLAQLAGRQDQFDRIWGWTRDHLQRPDGLLAYLTTPQGTVKDPTPASDADVLTAWALTRATGPQGAAERQAGRRMAESVLSRETIDRDGVNLLAAGPWATGSPGTLDPSYWSPEAFAGLASATADPRWTALADGARSAMAALTTGGSALPPDWARLDGATVTPTPAPSGQVPQVRFGLDAQRVLVWLAASCLPQDRRLAARWWPILRAGSRAQALALSPQGAVIDPATNALPPVAAAAAAAAAGDGSDAHRLLAVARTEQRAHPTYYGAAWLALGEAALDGTLGGCSPEGAS